MPTIKPILFFLALLLLIIPASAEDYVGYCYAYDDGSVQSTFSVYDSPSSLTSIAYVSASPSSSTYTYIETDYFTDVPVYDFLSPDDGIKFRMTGDASSDKYLFYNPTADQIATISGRVVWQGKYVSSSGNRHVRGYLYIESYSIVEPDYDSVSFAYEEEKPATWITVDYFIDGVESDYEEQFPGGIWEYDYEYSLLYSYIDPRSLITYESKYPVNNASGSHDYYIPVFSSDPWLITVDLVETLTVTNHWGSLSAVTEVNDTVLASDSLSVTSSANNTNPDEPEDPPDEPNDPPIDNPIDIPDDPFPDPIPGDNQTGEYNSTFLSGYYSTVDNITGAFFTPVEGGFTWLLYPVTTFNDSVGSTVIMVENSTAEMEEYTPVVASIMNPLINSMPPKVQALVTYNLLWVLVIMIFRRK
ncbi:hypothetical protein V7O62_02255 [Methanolobus sp. ZRKC2]|uniref:hypothetical protein n=1 Tax=Methanolobus sp. ZRKC2 TaxID=3125783 RepID=UPI00324AFD0E